MDDRNDGMMHFELPNYQMSDAAESRVEHLPRDVFTFTSVTHLQISMKHCMAACLVAGLIVPAVVKEAYAASEGEMLGTVSTKTVIEHIESMRPVAGTHDEHGWSPLAMAAYRGKMDVVKQLLSNGAHINEVSAAGYTALGHAAEAGNEAMVKFLMESGADVQLAGNREHIPLLLAVRSGDAQTVEQLLPHPQQQEMTKNYDVATMQRAYALAISAEKRHVIAQLLLSGITPEKTSPEASSLVWYAAKHGDVALLKWMKENGYALDTNDEKGKSALMYAANFGKLDTVAWLASSGANIRQADHQGYTALIYAAAKDHVEIVTLLVNLGADIRHQTEMGNTALHIAVARHNPKVVAYLATQKADFEQRNHDGQTPMMMAIAADDEVMVSALLEAGDSPYQPVSVVKNATGGLVVLLESYKKKHSLIKQIL